jgi:type I restriction enzyme, S subunit
MWDGFKMPSAGWCAGPLESLVTLQRGFDITKREQEPGPYEVISSSGPNSTHSDFKVAGPGVVIGRKGTLGTVFFSERAYWPHDTTLWVKDFHGNDPKFCYYFLKTLGFERFDCGASNPTLNRNHVHQLPIQYPAPAGQRRIASILCAYDDLIENNTRRIKILEDMAQMIYREWFVNFRLPGHEKVRMVGSELGPIPEGWVVRTVGTISDNFDSKRKPLSSMERAKRPGPYPYYGAAKVLDSIDGFLFDGRYLLFAEDGTVITDDRRPVLQLTNGKFWPNNHTHVLKGCSPISTYFLYLAMRQVDISGYITGAAQPKITQANLNRIPVLVASTELLRSFVSVCCPMLDQVAVLETKQANLRTTRDLLLPKLISGEIPVEAAAELMEETA